MTRVPSIVLLDNYDSFVHNLARYFRQLGCATDVIRSDQTTPAQLEAMKPIAIVISPGPCTPDEAGCSVEVVRQLSGNIPILGVCLGHQAIGAALGGKIVRSDPVHGEASVIQHTGTDLFAGLPQPMSVGRYHSLQIDRENLPSRIEVTASTAQGTIMAIADRRSPTWGVQFHPESILTEGGYLLLANFLRMAGVRIQPDVSKLKP